MSIEKPDDPEGLETRLTRVELQLRRIKALLVALAVVLITLLVPPLRAFLGLGIFIGGLVFAVLLFIALAIAILDWASKPVSRK